VEPEMRQKFLSEPKRQPQKKFVYDKLLLFKNMMTLCSSLFQNRLEIQSLLIDVTEVKSTGIEFSKSNYF
jgi:hypothetical protein